MEEEDQKPQPFRIQTADEILDAYVPGDEEWSAPEPPPEPSLDAEDTGGPTLKQGYNPLSFGEKVNQLWYFGLDMDVAAAKQQQRYTNGPFVQFEQKGYRPSAEEILKLSDELGLPNSYFSKLAEAQSPDDLKVRANVFAERMQRDERLALTSTGVGGFVEQTAIAMLDPSFIVMMGGVDKLAAPIKVGTRFGAAIKAAATDIAASVPLETMKVMKDPAYDAQQAAFTVFGSALLSGGFTALFHSKGKLEKDVIKLDEKLAAEAERISKGDGSTVGAQQTGQVLRTGVRDQDLPNAPERGGAFGTPVDALARSLDPEVRQLNEQLTWRPGSDEAQGMTAAEAMRRINEAGSVFLREARLAATDWARQTGKVSRSLLNPFAQPSDDLITEFMEEVAQVHAGVKQSTDQNVLRAVRAFQEGYQDTLNYVKNSSYNGPGSESLPGLSMDEFADIEHDPRYVMRRSSAPGFRRVMSTLGKDRAVEKLARTIYESNEQRFLDSAARRTGGTAGSPPASPAPTPGPAPAAPAAPTAPRAPAAVVPAPVLPKRTEAAPGPMKEPPADWDGSASQLEFQYGLDEDTATALAEKWTKEGKGKFTFGGRNSAGWDRAKHFIAHRMLKEGKDAREIWEKTGLYRAKDGKWRYHISEKRLVLKRGALENAKQAFDTRLGDLIHHPELFKAYPDLADMPVRVGDELPDGAYGWYEPDMDAIALGTEWGGAPRSEWDILSTLMHEVQHAIQKREGFSPGSSPKKVRNPERAVYKRLQGTPEFEAAEGYLETFQDEINFGAEEFDRLLLSKIGATDFDLPPKLQKEMRAKVDKLAKEFGRDNPEWYEFYRMASELADKGYKMEWWSHPPAEFVTDYKSYMRTLGEAEARNVQTRMGKADGDLMFPEDTLDVRPEDITVLKRTPVASPFSLSIAADAPATREGLIERAKVDFGPNAEAIFGDVGIEIVDEPPAHWPTDGYPIAEAVGNKVTMLAPRVDPEKLQGYILHEIGVHTDLENVIGIEGKARLIREVEDMAREAEEAVAAGTATPEQVRFAEARKAAVERAAEPGHTPEETLAYLVQEAPEAPVVKRFLADVKAWLYRTFPSLRNYLTMDEAALRQLAVSVVNTRIRQARKHGTLIKADGTEVEAPRGLFAKSNPPAGGYTPEEMFGGPKPKARSPVAKDFYDAALKGDAEVRKFLDLVLNPEEVDFKTLKEGLRELYEIEGVERGMPKSATFAGDRFWKLYETLKQTAEKSRSGKPPIIEAPKAPKSVMDETDAFSAKRLPPDTAAPTPPPAAAAAPPAQPPAPPTPPARGAPPPPSGPRGMGGKSVEEVAYGMARVAARKYLNTLERLHNPATKRVDLNAPVTPESRKAALELIREEFNDGEYFGDSVEDSIEMLLDLVAPIRKSSIESARAKPRMKLDLNADRDKDILGLWDWNAEALFATYRRHMAGRAGFLKAGFTRIQDFDSKVNAIRNRVANASEEEQITRRKEADNLDLIKSAILGTPPSWIKEGNEDWIWLTNQLRRFNYTRVMNNVGFLSLSEIMGTATKLGPGRLLTSIPGYRQYLKQIKSGDPKALESIYYTADALMGHGTQQVRSRLMGFQNRFEDGFSEALDRKTGPVREAVERFTRKAANATGRLSGMSGLTEWMRSAVAGADAQDWVRAARSGVVPYSKKRMVALGVNESMWNRISAQLKQMEDLKSPDTGQVRPFLDFSKWTDGEAANVFLNAIDRNSRRLVMEGDIGHKAFAFERPSMKLLFQFLQFPLNAWQKHLRFAVKVGDVRALSEAAAMAIGGGIGFIARVAAIAYLTKAAGDERDKYLEEQLGENSEEIYKAMFYYSAHGSVLPNAIDAGLSMLNLAGIEGGDGKPIQPLFSKSRASGLAGDPLMGNATRTGIMQQIRAVGSPFDGKFSDKDLENVVKAFAPLGNHVAMQMAVNQIAQFLPEEEE